MQRGFIKSWRKSLDNPLFKKPLIWHFWDYCLLKATRKEMDVFVNGTVVRIVPGQFVFGRSVAVSETGLSDRQIRTALKHLEALKNIAIKPSNKCSVITILNWEEYQGAECQELPKKATSKRPAHDQQNDQQSDQQKKPEDEGQQSNTTAIDQQNDQQNDQQIFSDLPKSDHIQEEQEEQEYIPPIPPRGKISKLKTFLLENIPAEFNGTRPKIIEFYEYRQQKPKAKRYQTEKGISGLFRDLSNCKAAGYNLDTCLDITMERGWQTPSVDYFKPEMFLCQNKPESKEDILKKHGIGS